MASSEAGILGNDAGGILHIGGKEDRRLESRRQE